MFTTLEIWKSSTGIAEEDFSLLAAIADPGVEIDWSAMTGQLYIYKARRYNSVTQQYSEFSNFLFMLGRYPEENSMANIGVNPGVGTKIGISVEGVFGQAAKSVRLLDRVDGQLTVSQKHIKKKGIRNHPGSSGSVLGEAEISGTLNIEVSPEGISEFLTAAFGAPTSAAVTGPAALTSAPSAVVNGAAGAGAYSYYVIASTVQGDSAQSPVCSVTTGNAALSSINSITLSWLPVNGATSYKVLKGTNLIANVSALTFTDTGIAGALYTVPAAATGNLLSWNAGLSQLSATITDYLGPLTSCRVFGGVQCSKIGIKFDKKANNPLTIGGDVMGTWSAQGLTPSQTGLSTAGWDPLSSFGVAASTATYIAGYSAEADSFDVTIDTALKPKSVLSGYTAPQSYYKGDAKHSVKATLYFDSETELERYFGVSIPQGGTYSPVNNIIYFPVAIVSTLPANAAGIINQLIVLMTYCAYELVGPKVAGKDQAVMQDVEIYPYIDPATGCDVIIQLVNSQTSSGVTTPGATITGLNGGILNPYTA